LKKNNFRGRERQVCYQNFKQTFYSRKDWVFMQNTAPS